MPLLLSPFSSSCLLCILDSMSLSQSSSPPMLQIEVHLDPKLLPAPTTAATSSKTTEAKAHPPPTSTSSPGTSITVTASTSHKPTSPLSLSSIRASTTSFLVPLPVNSFSPVCELKRGILHRTGIPPYLQRLSLLGDVDQFQFPSAVLLTKRSNRQEQFSILICTYNEQDPNMRWTLSVDPNDTVLDVKFLLSSTIKVAPEYQRLYVWRTGKREREQCQDSATLTAAGICSGCKLRILFEYPSSDPSHGTVHRSGLRLIDCIDPRVTTVGAMLRDSATKWPNRNCTGSRIHNKDGTRGPYTWLTYQQFDARVSNFGTGLLAIGLKKGDCLGIVGVNRPEWLLADLACAVQGMINVPLYDTLGPEAVQFIIGHAAVKAVVATRSNLSKIQSIRSKTPTLQAVILMDDESPDKAYVTGGGTGFTHTVSQIEKIGQQKGKAPDPFVRYTIIILENSTVSHMNSALARLCSLLPLCVCLCLCQSPNDLYSICYTSGTTGQKQQYENIILRIIPASYSVSLCLYVVCGSGLPKGALLTHRNMVSGCAAVTRVMSDDLMTDSEVVFSYLPLAHIYEQQVELGAIMRGTSIGFSQGDVNKLVDDVAELKPTYFPGVPRVWQRMYDRIHSQLHDSNFISRSLFDYAYKSRLQQLAIGNTDPSIWDKIVFHKIAQRFGGRLKMCVSGAAPLSPTVADFIKIAFVTGFTEGYGLTETAAIATMTTPESLSFGRSVGFVFECCEVKLVDVPDMNYLHTDQPNPRGEIWVRGANVFKGYYQQPELTQEVLTPDGWFMTGDVGMWLDNGCLKVIDRKKNLFKLAQGEYIRPEHIENVYKHSPYIANIYVHGDSLHNYLIAVIVPNLDNLQTTGVISSKTLSAKDMDKAKAAIFESMQSVAKKERLQGFEQVKKIVLVKDEFSVDNGLLTPTLKVKRHQASKMFAPEIAALYNSPDDKGKNTQINAKL